jgi:hypothetical protein
MHVKWSVEQINGKKMITKKLHTKNFIQQLPHKDPFIPFSPYFFLLSCNLNKLFITTLAFIIYDFAVMITADRNNNPHQVILA